MSFFSTAPVELLGVIQDFATGMEQWDEFLSSINFYFVRLDSGTESIDGPMPHGVLTPLEIMWDECETDAGQAVIVSHEMELAANQRGWHLTGWHDIELFNAVLLFINEANDVEAQMLISMDDQGLIETFFDTFMSKPVRRRFENSEFCPIF